MSRRRVPVVPLLLVTVLTLLLGAQLLRYRAARAEAVTAVDFAVQVARDGERLLQLRGRRPVDRVAAALDRDIVTAAASALEEAGIAFDAVSSISAGQTDVSRSAGASGRSRQTLRIALRGVAMPGLGAFLETWSAGHADWPLRSIRLAAAPLRPNEAERRYTIDMRFAPASQGAPR